MIAHATREPAAVPHRNEERPMTRYTAARWRLPGLPGAREKGELGGEG